MLRMAKLTTHALLILLLASTPVLAGEHTGDRPRSSSRNPPPRKRRLPDAQTSIEFSPEMDQRRGQEHNNRGQDTTEFLMLH